MLIQCVGRAIMIYQGALGRSFIGDIYECCDEISRIIKDSEEIILLPLSGDPLSLFQELKNRGMNPKFIRYIKSNERESD